MKILVKLLCVFAVIISSNGYACTCSTWQPKFSLVEKLEPVIVRAKVLDYEVDSVHPNPTVMQIEVIDPLKNANRSEKMLVWGDDGMSCMPYVGSFPIGTEWIFALSPGRAGRIENLRQFSLNGCGPYWFPVKDEKVSGELKERGIERNMSLDEFYRFYSLGKFAENINSESKAVGKKKTDGRGAPFLEVTEKRKEALKRLMIQRRFFAPLIGHCGELDEQTRIQSDKVWIDWNDRNDMYVTAAWQWKNYMENQASSEENGRENSPFGEAFSWDIRHSVDGLFDEIRPKGNLNSRACKKWLSIYANPKRDLINSKEFGRELKEFFEFYSRLMEYRVQGVE